MLEHDKDIVCGTYPMRAYPFLIVSRDTNGNRLDITEGNDLIDTGFAGTGCMMIKMDVFKKLPKPWFKVDWTGTDFMGEDYFFSQLARENGITIWTDPVLSREIIHVGQQRVDFNIHQQYKTLYKQKTQA